MRRCFALLTPNVWSQEIDEDEGVASVHEAVRLGVNFFDTSPFYGITRSEKARPRDSRGARCHRSRVIPYHLAILVYHRHLKVPASGVQIPT